MTLLLMAASATVGALFGALAVGIAAMSAGRCRHCDEGDNPDGRPVRQSLQAMHCDDGGHRELTLHVEDMTWHPYRGPSTPSPFRVGGIVAPPKPYERVPGERVVPLTDVNREVV